MTDIPWVVPVGATATGGGPPSHFLGLTWKGRALPRHFERGRARRARRGPLHQVGPLRVSDTMWERGLWGYRLCRHVSE